MPKKGHNDAYWEHTLRQYANGQFTFKIGQTPGKPKWKKMRKEIESCPCHKNKNVVDLFGRLVTCRCGYHETPETTPITHEEGTEISSSTFKTQETTPSTHEEGTESSSSTFKTQETTPSTHEEGTESSSSTFKTPETTPSTHEEGTEISSSTFKTPETTPSTHEEGTESSSSTFKAAITNQDDKSTICSLCHLLVPNSRYQEHVDKLHKQIETCDHCGKKFANVNYLLVHIETKHCAKFDEKSTSIQSLNLDKQQQFSTILPQQFKKVIQKCDQDWIAKLLYDSAGTLRDHLPPQNWYSPPSPPTVSGKTPNPEDYFRQRVFLWAPMRMWQIPLNCPRCTSQLQHGGLYPRAREVIDIDSRYYLIGVDYPRCGRCKLSFCPWIPDLQDQLDPSHRNMFPAVLTRFEALDRKCVTLMKPRTVGNSSSYLQQSLHEIHSEEWGRRCIQYFADCELHKKGAILTGNSAGPYKTPPPFRALPLAQWFETAHANEILNHQEEMKGVITSTYGQVLKLDSTKKVTKKLAGDVSKTASWMTNVANEHGQLLNCVFTTGEGPAIDTLCQGIVKRYRDAQETEPKVIYVDRDCCEGSSVHTLFRPWKSEVRLDIFHFMRRFTKGLTTEHHPLYGPFCCRFTNCVFEWDKDDFNCLRAAKKAELTKIHGCVPTEKQLKAATTNKELSRHCRKRTRQPDEIKRLIDKLLSELWRKTDTMGVPFINSRSMIQVWKTQQKHLECIQDPPGINLYTKIGTVQKEEIVLPVYRCARGSSSLESFHKHQCTFIPGWRANGIHTQMYMMEGSSRWNMNRSRDALDMASTSQTRLYDIHLMSTINDMSKRILDKELLPEFTPPGNPTDEKIAIEYLLAQSGEGDLRLASNLDETNSKFIPEKKTETEAIEEACINFDGLPEYAMEMSLEDMENMKFLEDILEVSEEEDEVVVELYDLYEPSLGDEKSGDTQCEISGVGMDTDEVVVYIPKNLKDSIVQPETMTNDAACENCGKVFGTAEMVVHMAEHMMGSTRQPETMTDDSACGNCDVVLGNAEMVTHMAQHVTDSTDRPEIVTESFPEQESRLDSEGYPGYDTVDLLSKYLVSLDVSISALSKAEVDRIIQLYDKLSDVDKVPTKYSVKSKKDVLTGPWRASRKRSGPTPGVQAGERLHLSGGQAAHCPSTNRVSACVCTRLSKIFQFPRNRPKDLVGKTLPMAQAIVQRYSHIQQLLADCRTIQERTNLVLVTVNNTTVNTWLNNKQKRQVKDSLLQGTTEQEQTAKESLPQASSLRTSHPVHGHTVMKFKEPHNRQGDSVKRQRKKKVQQSPQSLPKQSPQPSPQSSQQPSVNPYVYGPQQCFGWPPYFMHPMGQNILVPPPVQRQQPAPDPSVSIYSRQHAWRQRKAQQEDQERALRGEPPKKRYKKRGELKYMCRLCQKQKCVETGHTQYKGKWFCPASGITIEEWRSQFH